MSHYVDGMFAANSAYTDGVVRRKKTDVDRLGVLPEIIQRATQNGWHVIESETQIIVLCNTGHIQILA